VGSLLVHDRWAPAVRVTLSCHCCRTKTQRRTKTARRDEHENNETNRLDKLGNTSRHIHRRVNDVVGGPRTRREWEATRAVYTLMRVMCPAAAVSSRPIVEGSLGGLILAVTHGVFDHCW